MKASIIAAAAIALTTTAAQAKPMGLFIPNEAGGITVFTLEACPIDPANSMIVLGTTKSGKQLHGCWKVWPEDKRQVVVLWKNANDLYFFPIKEMQPWPKMPTAEEF
jgi:hypothetical protein